MVLSKEGGGNGQKHTLQLLYIQLADELRFCPPPQSFPLYTNAVRRNCYSFTWPPSLVSPASGAPSPAHAASAPTPTASLQPSPGNGRQSDDPPSSPTPKKIHGKKKTTFLQESRNFAEEEFFSQQDASTIVEMLSPIVGQHINIKHSNITRISSPQPLYVIFLQCQTCQIFTHKTGPHANTNKY